ncbi:MAG: zinc ribbon domain-containing protein [Verrucomicrobiaceae bacterium]|nr:zinc ribbon domain-containing protein [Verrucomicrobiaceae bacterium]
MSCPSCGASSSLMAAFCAACGFSLKTLQDGVGQHRVLLGDALVDPSKILRIAEFQDIQKHIDEFERRFPQIKATVFIGDLPLGVDVNGAVVWLINQGVVMRQDQIHPAEWTIALIIAPSHSQVSVGVGYALESILSHASLAAILGNARHHLWHREYGRAVRGILDGCQKLLVAAGKSRPRSHSRSGVVEGDHLGLPQIAPQRPVSVEKTISF